VNPSYKLASIPQYDDIVQTAGWVGSVRAAGRRSAAEGGVLNITAAVWTAGFHWWHSGNKKQTQNVSKYMLVLALCLVLNVCSHQYQHQHHYRTNVKGILARVHNPHHRAGRFFNGEI